MHKVLRSGLRRTFQNVKSQKRTLFAKKEEVQETIPPGRYVVGWGSNANGALGVNTTIKNYPRATPIMGFRSHATKNRVEKLSAGALHVLSVTENGDVYSWGSNTYGQLGVGDKQNSLGPIKVKALAGKKVVNVSAGDYTSAAVTEEGHLYTWGYGGGLYYFFFYYPSLGHDDKTTLTVPKLVDFLAKQNVKIVQASCGTQHMGAISEKGIAYTWGRGDWGRLGHNSNSSHRLPKEIDPNFLNNEEAVKISCSSNSTGILTKAGKIYVFGKNEAFQLGVESSGAYIGGGTLDGVLKPTVMKFFTDNGILIKDMAIGDKLRAAVTTQGDAYMWGRNITTPQKLSISNLVSCSAGTNHVGFLSESGRAYLIGGNWNKQLGVSSSMMSRDVYEPDHKGLNGKFLAVECGGQFTVALMQIE